MIFTNFNVFGIVMKYGIKLLILFLKQSEFSEGNYGCKNEKFLNLISTHSLNIISFVISSWIINEFESNWRGLTPYCTGIVSEKSLIIFKSINLTSRFLFLFSSSVAITTFTTLSYTNLLRQSRLVSSEFTQEPGEVISLWGSNYMAAAPEVCIYFLQLGGAYRFSSDSEKRLEHSNYCA